MGFNSGFKGLTDKWKNYIPSNAHPFHLDGKTLFCSENIKLNSALAV